jgi:cytochrome c oxidase cbb3-type subunit 3
MSYKIQSSIQKKSIFLMMALVPALLMAQSEAPKAAATASNGGDDLVWYMIYGVMAVLLFVILLLGNVLVNLAYTLARKSSTKAAVVIGLLLLSGNAFSQQAPAAAATAASSGASVLHNWNMIMAFSVLIAELFAIVVLLINIRRMVGELSPKKETEVVEEREVAVLKILDNINASVSIEKEKDILLDHDYDGIHELDNNLPPWWKYSFIISIFWAVAYFSYYHVLGGPSSHDEYDKAMREAKEQQDEYARLNANKVDENTVTLADAAGINDGKDVFTTNCAPCHGQKGEGVVGPNLTDDYWLHGGNIKDVFKSIKYGWPAKGMKSWQQDLTPMQIKNVASYIKSLHGTNPANAKAPQGDLYQENAGTAPATADSTKQASADTVKAKGI